MSFFTESTLAGGYGFGTGWGFGVAQQAAQAPDPDAKAKPAKGDALQRDNVMSGVPWGLAYDDLPRHGPDQYWEMLQYSAVSLCIGAIRGPIEAGQRGIEIVKADGEPAKMKQGLLFEGPTEAPEDKAKKAYERLIAPLWPDILSSLNSLWMGNWPQVVQYERRENLTVPCKFIDFGVGDLLAGRVRVEQYNGEFAKLIYTGGKNGEQPFARPYVFYSVCNASYDPLYGVPRTFFAREPWWRAKESEKNGDRIQRKASGSNLLLHVFRGTRFRDATGAEVSAEAGVQGLINALNSGGVGRCERSMFPPDVIKGNPALADISPVKVDKFDWGSTGPDLMAQIARLDALDKRIARGIGVPERALMEATTAGSRADSVSHGEQVDDASDQEHKRTLREFNAQVFDPTLVTNHGPDWRGRLRWVATPTDAASEAAKDALIQAIVPTLQPSPVDLVPLLKERKIPTVVGYVQPTAAPAPLGQPGDPQAPQDGVPDDALPEDRDLYARLAGDDDGEAADAA